MQEPDPRNRPITKDEARLLANLARTCQRIMTAAAARRAEAAATEQRKPDAA
jgi:hypothetical protein